MPRKSSGGLVLALHGSNGTFHYPMINSTTLRQLIETNINCSRNFNNTGLKRALNEIKMERLRKTQKILMKWTCWYFGNMTRDEVIGHHIVLHLSNGM